MIEAVFLAMVLNAPCDDDVVCTKADAPGVAVTVQATGKKASARRVRVTAGKAVAGAAKVTAAPLRLIGRVVHRISNRERLRPLRHMIEHRRAGGRPCRR